MQCCCSCLNCLENEPEARCAVITLAAPTAVQKYWAQAFKGKGIEKLVVEVQKSSVLYE